MFDGCVTDMNQHKTLAEMAATVVEIAKDREGSSPSSFKLYYCRNNEDFLVISKSSTDNTEESEEK